MIKLLRHRAYPLPVMFKHWGIDPSTEHVFMKIDVESFECEMLPSWSSWLAGMSQKPTMYLSMHGQVMTCSEKQYSQIARIASSYRYVQSGLLSADKTTINKRVGEFVLSDVLPPPSD